MVARTLSARCATRRLRKFRFHVMFNLCLSANANASELRGSLPLWLQSRRERMLQATRRKHPKDELHAQLPLQTPSQCQQVSAICETRHDTRAPLSAGLQSEASSLMRGLAGLELSVMFGAWGCGCVTNDEHQFGRTLQTSLQDPWQRPHPTTADPVSCGLPVT